MMTLALILRILVAKAFVDVDQMHSVLGRQIDVTTERANVVRMMNAPENNIVTRAIAKVPHGQSPNLLFYYYVNIRSNLTLKK